MSQKAGVRYSCNHPELVLDWAVTLRRIAPTVFFLCVGALLPSAKAGSIDAIYAFGDSLTDVGNAAIATSGAEPAAPYVNGQFSNGPVWVQGLAAGLGLAPLTPSLASGTDYAVGSAQTGVTLFNAGAPQDLLTGQIPAFLTANPTADPNALYTIWIGANDLEAIPLGATQPQIATDIAEAVGNIDTSIADLAAAGAKNFLIVTVPNLGLTPAVTSLGAPAEALYSELAEGFDATLVNGSSPIPSLATIAGLDGLNISVLDTYSLLNAIVGNPGSFGFSNVTQPCLTGEVNYAGGTVCSASLAVQNQYLFWDDTHPTAATHAIIADDALAVLAPEPSSIILTSCGLLGLGLIIRKRRVTART